MNKHLCLSVNYYASYKMGKSVILTLTNVGSKPTAGRAVQLCWGGGTNTDPALAFEVFSHFFFQYRILFIGLATMKN